MFNSRGNNLLLLWMCLFAVTFPNVIAEVIDTLVVGNSIDWLFAAKLVYWLLEGITFVLFVVLISATFSTYSVVRHKIIGRLAALSLFFSGLYLSYFAFAYFVSVEPEINTYVGIRLAYLCVRFVMSFVILILNANGTFLNLMKTQIFSLTQSQIVACVSIIPVVSWHVYSTSFPVFHGSSNDMYWLVLERLFSYLTRDITALMVCFTFLACFVGHESILSKYASKLSLAAVIFGFANVATVWYIWVIKINEQLDTIDFYRSILMFVFAIFVLVAVRVCGILPQFIFSRLSAGSKEQIDLLNTHYLKGEIEITEYKKEYEKLLNK
jgi:hypothetical protein